MSGRDRRDSPFYRLGQLSARYSTGQFLLAFLAVGLLLALWTGLVSVRPATVVGLVLLGVGVAAVVDAVVIVQAYEKRALTVFGEYRGLLAPGLHVVPPFVSAASPFDLRTQTLDVPPQEAITEDNAPVRADAVVYIRVMDAERTFLGVEDYERAVSSLAQTTLRAAIGDMKLDALLSQRTRINQRIHRELEEPTDEWGVRVEAVEVSEIMPSAAVVAAMEQQTGAERRRRATILEANGERQSAVERALGDRTAAVVRAQGEKQSRILSAQGDAVATVLRANAAQSMGERAVVDRGLETLAAIGSGPATTYVVPQEFTAALGRYGRRLAADGEPAATLDAQSLDREVEDLLGLDDVDDLVRAAETN